MTIGITGFGVYLPWRRLQRAAIAEAQAWCNPAASASAKGQRAMASWDEDTITMAVEAARDCLGGPMRDAAAVLYLASTTAPFADRQNAGVVAGALTADERVASADFGGGLRAGAAALLAGLAQNRSALVVASERRKAPALGAQEFQIGDGAACVLLGHENIIARRLGDASATEDFVDHFREVSADFDYAWEERWIRDEGFKKIAPRTIARAIEAADVAPDRVTALIAPTPFKRLDAEIAKAVGIDEKRVRRDLIDQIGHLGAAHPLFMLCHALEEANPGDCIVMASVGQGCDVVVFEVTDAIGAARAMRGVRGHLARGAPETNYLRYLVFNDLIDQEKGKRSERDKQTALTTAYRKRDMLASLTGGECRSCGTRQFPRGRICVNPNCRETDSQTAYSFADVPAQVMSWSADYLAFTLDPPAHYGVVTFEGGGRFLTEFTDVGAGDIAVGAKVEMVFRVKDFDPVRRFRRYFWKATPARAGAE